MNVADTGLSPALSAMGVQTLAFDDERYPPLLRLIPDPPALLYALGDVSLLREPQVAMVGSRRASPAGLRTARDLAQQLAATGLLVCSGLALGVDGAAHRGALAAKGKSIAVMATGIDLIYPRRHRDLAAQLQGNGCLLTEFRPGTPPRRQNFPQRNRIISGLSLGVVVVEAALPSGSLITANTALEQGREVFALPWSMLHRGGEGCLQLLRDGAKMVRELQDILEELGPLYALHNEMRGAGMATAQAAADSPGSLSVLELLGFEASSVDQLVAGANMPVEQLLVQLSELELLGLVQRCPGGYIRC
ncbi:MAG: DNA-processing protein DprA [Gammaproteobacteria bacterium]|nr:DNA-processing protein DprA [Gammaproteobacteria bacterium]